MKIIAANDYMYFIQNVYNDEINRWQGRLETQYLI